ncbi:MAG: prepilin-type N-terminal cleavage/methylation domain-containing protein [Candidatus Sericytochromatia bacterium]|nr:prepilin-type N-terminal cleavage/methylation domain-containing protein [Candidatus Sericytochromatia bacterium]
MLKQRKNWGRQGFTLVEVALAVAVGLIVIGGAVLGYNSVKENANNSNARQRVLSALTIVEEYSSANGGRYPASTVTNGTFQQLWASKRPDDKNLNPWGGATGDSDDGAIELAAADFGGASEAAVASETTTTTALLASPLDETTAANAGNLVYVSATNASTPWAAVRKSSTVTTLAAKNFVIGICGKDGTPYWDAASSR